MDSRWKLDRLAVMLLLFCFVTGLTLFRLFEKQVIEYERYAKAAEAQSTSQKSQPAARGRILSQDRDGKLYVLAVSQQRYQLLISPRQVKNKRALADALHQLLPQLPREEILGKIDNDKVYIPPLARGLEEAVVSKLRDRKLAGVFLVPEFVRLYPEGADIAPQVIGFVGADSQGKYGVEAVYDSTLRGLPGREVTKRDSLGRLINILGITQPTTGQDIVLTLDYNLQFLTETELAEAMKDYRADSGTIVVMQPKTGAILALASLPKFDPNKYSTVPVEQQRRFLPSAVSDLYEPGSVVKPLVLAAALDLGLVKPETVHAFGSTVKVLDKIISNVDGKAFGRQTMGQVLENSDNVAMVWISSLIGAERERESLAKFGFGTKSGVDLIGDQAGILPPLRDWNELLRATAAFGQGISVTTIQLAAAYAALANGGTLVTPHVGQRILESGRSRVISFPNRGQIIKPETAAQLREMLVGVVERGHGKKAAVPGLRVAGKTGTAQVPRPEGGYYDDRHIGSFAGYFPADDPQVVMVVRLDNPKTVRFAEASAAPTFGRLATKIAQYYQLR